MFDLSTAPSIDNIESQQRHFTGAFVDDDGMIDAFHYVLEGSYYHDEGTKYEYDTVIKSYSNKLILVKSYSKYNKVSEYEIDTSTVQIESNEPIIQSRFTYENKWGSVRECLNLSLRNEIFCNIYAARRTVPDMNTTMTLYQCPENAIQLQLVLLTDDGIKVISGIVRYEFRDDRTDTCPSCVQGFATFEESINKIGKHIIANTTKATFNGYFIHDFDCSSDMAITRSLNDAFRPVIELARIKTITFEEIK